MSQLFNKGSHKELRRELRKNMTEPEKLLWFRLRGVQLGHRFRPQYGVGRYILDFYCPKLRLAVEVDGESHADPDAQEYDGLRDAYLKSLNVITLRFANRDVLKNVEGVLEQIQTACRSRSETHPPAPSSQERESLG